MDKPKQKFGCDIANIQNCPYCKFKNSCKEYKIILQNYYKKLNKKGVHNDN